MAFFITYNLLMATEKNSFLLYCDIIHTVEKLKDVDAGALLKHILRYVNDQQPVTDNAIVEIAFEPIKQSLKRDLLKYENIRTRNSANAKKRWDAKECDRIPNVPSDTKNADSDSVSDSVISKDIYIKATLDNRKQKFADSLVPFLEKYGKDMLNKFYMYWTEHGERDKKMRFEKEKAFNLVLRLTNWLERNNERKKIEVKLPPQIID